MYEQQSSTNKDKDFYFQNYISASSPKLKSQNGSMMLQFKKIMHRQSKQFQEIQQGCSFMQNAITNVENMLQSLQDKINQLTQFQERQTIFNLKNKQNQFIIGQLRQKIKRLEENEQQKEIQVRHLKRQVDIIKREKYKNDEDLRVVFKLKTQVNQLHIKLQHKDNEIESLKKMNSKVKLEELSSRKSIEQEQEYKALQDRLTQFEKQFQEKILQMQSEIDKKDEKIKTLKKALQSSESNLITNNSSVHIDTKQNRKLKDSSCTSVKCYQLQVKYKQQQNLYHQLEQQYNKILTKSNATEISLHQQIHQLKSTLNDEKKTMKKSKKSAIQSLQRLATYINKRNFSYFTSHQIEQVVQELKTMINKDREKVKMEIDLLKNQIQLLKTSEVQKQKYCVRLRQNQKKLREQISTLKKKISSLEQQQHQQSKQSTIRTSNKRSSLNGSFAASSKKSDSISMYEDKFKEIIDNLRIDVKHKQSEITQLEKVQNLQFEKFKQKILNLQMLVADSKNELKKGERQKLQIIQQKQNLMKQIKSLRLNKENINEKLIKEKEDLKANYQDKIKNMDQRYFKLKESYQLMDSKCQQKVMKYNKLKSKVQKMQMYNSETEKRKDLQIDDLVKKNQTLKFENKSLMEKINLSEQNSQVQEQQISRSSKQTPFNKDLVEQIQMQRDRILEQYEQKRKQFLKVKTQKQNLSIQITSLNANVSNLQTEVKHVKKQNEQIISAHKKQIQLSNVNKETLQKQIKELKNSLQTRRKDQYQHFKKQLQNTINEKKKLEHESKKLNQSLKNFKDSGQKKIKEISDLKNKILSLSSEIERLKSKIQDHKHEIHQLKGDYQKKIKALQRKLSQASVKQQNLINIINYNNNTGDNVRQSMKGDEQMEKNEQQFDNNNDFFFNNNNNDKDILTIQNQTQTDIHELRRDKNFNRIKIQPITIVPLKKILTTCSAQAITIEGSKQQKQYCKPMTVDSQISCSLLYSEEVFKQIMLQIHPQLMNKLKTVQNGKVLQQQKEQNKCKDNYVKQMGVNTEVQKINKFEQNSNNNNNEAEQNALYILQDEILGSYHQESETDVVDQNIQTYQQEEDQKAQKQLMAYSSRAKRNSKASQDKPVEVNLFQNLELECEQIDDNFQICEEGQSINVGQTALNLQIKQIFEKLRQELQKVFNGEDISFSMIRILPRRLEDDYNQLIVYIKEKIEEIKNQNQLSFIMAQVGDQLEQEQMEQDLDQELKGFITKKVSEDLFTYKRLVEEKQALITSLMNERTQQQNTINQMTMEKEQIQEQNQNRFMNQCAIYKKQVKQCKKRLDQLEMDFQSIKNVFKNSMQIWVEQEENQDDLRDNFAIYRKLARLTEVQATRLNYYIFRYRQIKGVLD